MGPSELDALLLDLAIDVGVDAPVLATGDDSSRADLVRRVIAEVDRQADLVAIAAAALEHRRGPRSTVQTLAADRRRIFQARDALARIVDQ